MGDCQIRFRSTRRFNLGRACWQSFAFEFRANLTPVTLAGTEFRLAACIREHWSPRDFGRSKSRAVTNQVPLGRYFFFVGILLLGMLFIADWYLPSASSQTFFREARVDKSIIRIKSAHKWPEPVVFDTSLPKIVQPPLPVLAEAPVINQPRQTLAQLISPLPKALEYRAPVRVKRDVAKQARPTRMAAYRAPQEAIPLIGNAPARQLWSLVRKPTKDVTRRQPIEDF
jgi:hypothetical protein